MAPSGSRSLAGQQLVGRVLAGRYRIEAVIGTGASGRAYAATDTRLGRRVAVKVLHAGLAEDKGFQRRFQAEAQLAASLHHPNIVTVHDWGEDQVSDDERLTFMVLELLEGGSLRSMLDADTLLTPAQAARIGADVAAALDYAHRRGIIHRDIKPANLLFDEHGVVRIADFGLARALAEASWTEPSGAVFGTARYASPEQWLGVQLDARSDLYALALVIVESVTGDIPFAADTTLGLLSARTRQPIVAPEKLGLLGAVVERAGRVDMRERYPDAATMRAALLDVAEALPKPGPLQLAGTAEGGGTDPHPTSAVGTHAGAKGKGTKPARPTAKATKQAPVVVAGADGDDIEVIEPDPVVLFDQDDHDDDEDTAATGARRAGSRSVGLHRPSRWVPLMVALAVVAVISGIGFAVAKIAGGNTAARIAVPGFVGRPLADATAIAKNAGVELTTRRAPSRTSDPAGTVIDQEPAAGGFVNEGDGVALVISTGPPKVKVPALDGRKLAAAQQQLRTLGLAVVVERAFDEAVEQDRVISQNVAAGNKVEADSSVTLVVSDGPEPRTIPNLAGSSWNDAKSQIEGLGLVPKYNEAFSDTVDVGEVISTSPSQGNTAPRGSDVTVLVSKGPDLVAMPSVVGQSLDDATRELERAGFVVDTIKGYRPGREVRRQSIAAGTEVRRGTSVDLFF